MRTDFLALSVSNFKAVCRLTIVIITKTPPSQKNGGKNKEKSREMGIELLFFTLCRHLFKLLKRDSRTVSSSETHSLIFRVSVIVPCSSHVWRMRSPNISQNVVCIQALLMFLIGKYDLFCVSWNIDQTWKTSRLITTHIRERIDQSTERIFSFFKSSSYNY